MNFNGKVHADTSTNESTMNLKIKETQRRVFICDCELIACGLQAVLNETVKDIAISYIPPHFPSLMETIGKTSESQDLLILEINFGIFSQIEWIKQLLAIKPELRILILSAANEKMNAARCVRAGAIGFISKLKSTSYISEKIQSALDGGIVLSDEVTSSVMGKMIGNPRVNIGLDPIETLSDREFEVYSLIGKGHSTRQIAEILMLSIKTIETYRAHIKGKLDLKNATELTQHAVLNTGGHEIHASACAA